MKSHDFTPNLSVSRMHLKTPTLAAVEKETPDLSSHCIRITPMVTLLHFMLQEFQALLSVELIKC